MIRKVDIDNFKCFQNITLPLSTVNILTGLNGMGKSTVIQSLLLLRQSNKKDGEIKGLSLNGEYVQLGNAQDILFEKSEQEWIGLGYEDEKEKKYWRFQYVPESDYLPVLEGHTPRLDSRLFSNRFSYLSAYRIQPQNLYKIQNEKEITNREFGNDGEFALQYLAAYGDEEVSNESVVVNDKLGKTLKNQTRVWLDRISPGVSPQVLLNLQLRNSEVRYEFIEGREKTKSYKSVNVGFGITYVLPVVIMLLSSKKGDIIILENPEAHIHPAGQSMLGELIARVGAGGVQIIAETHSDHILNGLRLAVKNQIISKEETSLSFFYKDVDDSYKHKAAFPQILDDGRIDFWPEGFFDEWDKALYELI